MQNLLHFYLLYLLNCFILLNRKNAMIFVCEKIIFPDSCLIFNCYCSFIARTQQK